jgi:predicted phage tail protein
MDMSLEELMNMLISRLEGLSASVEDLRFRINIIGSALTDQDVIKKEDIRAAVRKQLNIMKYLGSADNVDFNTVEGLTESIMNWFDGDMSAIKAEYEQYKKIMEEAEEKIKKEGQRIEIAGPGSLGDLKNKER